MVGYAVRCNPNMIQIWKDGKTILLDQDECNKLASLIWVAQRRYWEKSKIAKENKIK